MDQPSEEGHMRFRHFVGATLAFAIAGAVWPAALAEDAADAWVKKIDKRVARMRPSTDETRFDLIAWAPGLRDAIAAAKASGRPVFLFTNSGHINTGRC
jgi:hypothetical protein